MTGRPEDIFSAIKVGDDSYVLEWLSSPGTLDLNQGDGHGFTPLIWAAYYGRSSMIDKFLAKGALPDVTNMGGDTALHQAASRGYNEICTKLLKTANPNVANEHGNTPLHYACFWNHVRICQHLVSHNASVSLANKFTQIPLNVAKPDLALSLKQFAKENGQDLTIIPFNSKFEQRNKTDMQLKSKPIEADVKGIAKSLKLGNTPSGESWKASWSGFTVVAKKLNVHEESKDKFRYFVQEANRLRIFTHSHILPLIALVNDIHQPFIMSIYCSRGSLFEVLHAGQTEIEAIHKLNIIKGIGRGMQYLHSLDPIIPRFSLTPYHVMIDENFNAMISLADAKFSFQDNLKIYHPQWYAPEALKHSFGDINRKMADIYSYAIVMWEICTGQIPFSNEQILDPMLLGRKIATGGYRPLLSASINPHMAKIIDICWNADPLKRPPFDKVMPIIEKLK